MKLLALGPALGAKSDQKSSKLRKKFPTISFCELAPREVLHSHFSAKNIGKFKILTFEILTKR